MPFNTSGYGPLGLAQWLDGIRARVLEEVPAAEVVDQRYILARVLLVVAEELARGDGSFALAMAMLDPVQAQGFWLRLCAMRFGVPAVLATRTTATGQIKGTPGTVFTGAEQAEDKTTGVRWTVGPGVIGVTGTSPLPMVALADGPIQGSTSFAQWKLKTELDGWTQVRVLELTSLGRLAETDDALRVRVLGALGSVAGSEFGDIALFAQLALTPGESALLAYKTNRDDVPDSNGIPPHHFEAVFRTGLPPEQVANAIRKTASATAGTWGNRSATIAGPYGPLTYRYSEGEDLRIYARIFAFTFGAQGTLPADMADQLKGHLAAWTLTLGAGNVPLASKAQEYVMSKLPVPAALSGLSIDFSLDNVIFFSYIPVTIRQTPRINNEPTAAELVGVVPGPYTLNAADSVTLYTVAAGAVLCDFTGTETTITDVVERLRSFGVTDLEIDPTSEDAGATLRFRSSGVGAAASFEIQAATANFLASMGLPAVPLVVTGKDTDITHVEIT